MKFLPIIAVAALMMPMAANAQSLTDTHELVWHPAGKTPAATYRLRDKPKCAARSDDHRAGKGQYRAAKPCPASDAAAKAAKSAE